MSQLNVRISPSLNYSWRRTTKRIKTYSKIVAINLYSEEKRRHQILISYKYICSGQEQACEYGYLLATFKIAYILIVLPDMLCSQNWQQPEVVLGNVLECNLTITVWNIFLSFPSPCARTYVQTSK